MIHVLTAHFGTSLWTAPQRACFEAFVPQPYRVLCSVEGFDASEIGADPASRWSVIEQHGSHAEKLNDLARRALRDVEAGDVLLFVDGDALPVGDLADILEVCRRGSLVAVRRDENLGDPQPHPSFCAVRADVWHSLAGDWSPGPTWVSTTGRAVTDVGARLWATLRARRHSWTPLLRTCTHPLHAVWFGVYGELVYHHGAGFRFPVCRHDVAASEVAAASPAARGTWCQERGLASRRLGAEIFARIVGQPVNTLQRCRDGSLFRDLEAAV
jgi:hypothetical protein